MKQSKKKLLLLKAFPLRDAIVYAITSGAFPELSEALGRRKLREVGELVGCSVEGVRYIRRVVQKSLDTLY